MIELGELRRVMKFIGVDASDKHLKVKQLLFLFLLCVIK